MLHIVLYVLILKLNISFNVNQQYYNPIRDII